MNGLVEVLYIVLVFGDGTVRHPDPVCVAFLDHHGNALRQKYARLEFIADSTAAGQKVPCDLVGLFGGGIAVVAEDNVRHESQTKMAGIVPARLCAKPPVSPRETSGSAVAAT